MNLPIQSNMISIILYLVIDWILIRVLLRFVEVIRVSNQSTEMDTYFDLIDWVVVTSLQYQKLYDAILQMPNGFDTMVGERGLKVCV